MSEHAAPIPVIPDTGIGNSFDVLEQRFGRPRPPEGHPREDRRLH